MRRRSAFTLIEALLAVCVTGVMFGATMHFMTMGQRSVVKTSDHAEARMEAMRILDAIGWDLDRLVVGNEIDDPEASVIRPFKRWVDTVQQGASFGFYAFHHRVYYRTPPKPYMVLHGRWIDYRVEKVAGGGVNLLRNDRVVNRFPMHDVKIEKVDADRAAQLGLSREHCVRISVLPRGRWDAFDEDLWRHNAQVRVFHLAGVESRYAALLSLKRVLRSTGQPPPPGYEKVTLLPEPPAADPNDPTAGTVILNWMQPQAVVYLDRSALFDDATADVPVTIPPFPGS